MKNYFNFTEAERGEKEPRLHKCFPSLLTFPQPQLQPPQQQQQQQQPPTCRPAQPQKDRTMQKMR